MTIDTKKWIVEKADKVTNYFVNKYGLERAEIIIRKIAPSINTMSVDDMIKVGEKWHWFNLMMNGKCSYEECHKALTELGYAS